MVADPPDPPRQVTHLLVVYKNPGQSWFGSTQVFLPKTGAWKPKTLIFFCPLVSVILSCNK